MTYDEALSSKGKHEPNKKFKGESYTLLIVPSNRDSLSKFFSHLHSLSQLSDHNVQLYDYDFGLMYVRISDGNTYYKSID